MPTKVKSSAPARRPAATKKTSKPAVKRSTATKKTSQAGPTKKSSSAKSAAKAPTDTSSVSADKQQASANGKSLFGGIFDAFGGLGKKASGSLSPLEFSPDEKKAGQSASDTLDRLAGPDGKWDADDLGRNVAQLQVPRGIKGIAARGIATRRLMESHGLDPKNDELRNQIMSKGHELSQQNPDIAKLHKLEGMKTDGFSDEQRQKYDQMVGGLREDLGGKGLLPVSLDQLQDFGDSADLLKNKLGERGIEPPKAGTPVDAEQFRGLFEGQSPLRSMF